MKPWSENISFPKPVRAVSLRTEQSDRETALHQQALLQSYERGRRDAEVALSQQLIQQRHEIHEIMRGVLESLRQSVPQIMRDSEDTMIALSLSVAQKLVAGLPITVEMVEGAVKDALAQIEGTAQFTVRLHPADLELLQKADSPLLANGDGAKEFRFISAPEVTRGGCIVHTQFGVVDARRETKFDLIQRTLTE